MQAKLKAFLRDEPLLRQSAISLDQPKTPQLSIVTDKKPAPLTKKEQEACNRATD